MMEFLDGVAFTGFLAVAVWFAHAWRGSRDRLLLAFAVAFAVFALNRLVLVITEHESEAQTIVYLCRALGFAIIIVAVLDRNRSRT